MNRRQESRNRVRRTVFRRAMLWLTVALLLVASLAGFAPAAPAFSPSGSPGGALTQSVATTDSVYQGVYQDATGTAVYSPLPVPPLSPYPAACLASNCGVAKLTIIPNQITVSPGRNEQFTASAVMSDGWSKDVTSLAAWASSETAVAAVSQATAGQVYALAAGSSTVTAAYAGMTGSAALTVDPPVLTVTPNPGSVAAGETLRFTAQTPSGRVVTAGATWSSSDKTVATMDTTTPGQADSLAAGNTTITAVYNDMSGTATLDVGPPVPVGLNVSPSAASIVVGRTQRFSAAAELSDGTSADVTGQATWTSSDKTVATMDASVAGQADSLAGGTTTISAVYGGQTGKAGLTVTAAPLALTAIGTGLPDGTVGSAYTSAAITAYVTAGGGTPPYSYSVGGLPSGLAFDSASEEVTGTPTAAGTASVTVTVTDTAGSTATLVLTLTVNSQSGGSGGGAGTTSNSPTVSGVSPDQGPSAGGTQVTITGTNFTDGATVDFGANPATGIDVVSATGITVISPPGDPGAYDVTVTTAAGTSAKGAADRFTYYLAAQSGGGPVPQAPAMSSGVPAGALFDRSDGSVFAGDGKQTDGIPDGMVSLSRAVASIAIPVDTQPPGPDYSIQVYHWQPLPLAGSGLPSRWVALATSMRDGRAVAFNDGGYTGWFGAWWVIEPRYDDIAGTWAENDIKRMNGLGLLEGYSGTGLSRTFGPGRFMTRAEFTVVAARIPGLNPAGHAYALVQGLSPAQATGILRQRYSDWRNIPGWAAPYAAAMSKAGYIRGMDGRFNAGADITRLQAGVVVSGILKAMGYAQPADLSRFRDAVPGWAAGKLANGVLNGGQGLLRPNDPLTRAEAAAMLLRLLRDLGF